ncbi:MAG: DUF2752 domain-containing protein [Anaerohalosphaeraceae bacterium]|nr:DUF2752 domain-containing protein [Anaerohalosphaeraceae bacterium]
MEDSEKSNSVKWFYRTPKGGRLGHLAVFLVALAFFAVLYMVKADIINPSSCSGTCGFKQRYDIPCPTCGMTTAAKAFMSGEIARAFYIQPGIAMFCLLVATVAFFSLLSACLGVNFSFLPPVRLWRGGYIILVLFIIFAAGWAVTLARAIVDLP